MPDTVYVVLCDDGKVDPIIATFSKYKSAINSARRIAKERAKDHLEYYKEFFYGADDTENWRFIAYFNFDRSGFVVVIESTLDNGFNNE